MTQSSITSVGLLFAIVSSAAIAPAAAQVTFTCPPVLTLRIEKAAPSADSSSAAMNFMVDYQDAVALLKDADIFKGPGKGGNRTVPDDSDEGKPAIYRRFEVHTNGAQPRGDLYAVCHYEGGVSLDRLIGRSARSCRLERSQQSKADDKLEIRIACDGVTASAASAANAPAPATGTEPRPTAGRVVDCTLVVRGKPMIRERCSFVAKPGGSFIISNPRYAAAVDVAGPGQGSGRWSADAGVGAEPTSDLGPLTRKGACWVNEADRISICAR